MTPLTYCIVLLLLMTMILPGKAKEVREFKTALGKQAAERAWKPQGRWDKRRTMNDNQGAEGELSGLFRKAGLHQRPVSVSHDVKEFIKDADGRRGTGLSQSEINDLVRKYVTASYKKAPGKWDKRRKQQYQRRVKYLMNVISHETHMGTHPDTDGDGRGYGYGLAQFDPIRHKGISDSQYYRKGMTDVVNRFKDRFGMEPSKWSYDDMNEHEKNIAGMVIAMQPHFHDVKEMPETVEGHHGLYSTSWNQGGKGTLDKFRRDVRKHRGEVNVKPWTKPWANKAEVNTQSQSNPEQGNKLKRYTIQKGDNLSSIARRKGLSSWQSLYEANKEKIKDPDRIRPGTELVIPQGQ